MAGKECYLYLNTNSYITKPAIILVIFMEKTTGFKDLKKIYSVMFKSRIYEEKLRDTYPADKKPLFSIAAGKIPVKFSFVLLIKYNLLLSLWHAISRGG